MILVTKKKVGRPRKAADKVKRSTLIIRTDDAHMGCINQIKRRYPLASLTYILETLICISAEQLQKGIPYEEALKDVNFDDVFRDKMLTLVKTEEEKKAEKALETL